MAVNTQPIYPRQGDLQWVPGYMTAQNTTADLTSGTRYLVFTADATEGSWLREISFKPTPAGNTTLTVARIWINNGQDVTVADNNVLLTDVTLQAVTASANTTVTGIVRALNIALPPGYRVYITLGTASANGWAAVGKGGKY